MNKTRQKDLFRFMDEDQDMLKTSLFGIVVIDPTGRCVYINQSGADTVGKTMEQFIGFHLFSLESWKQSGLTDACLRVLKTGTPETVCHRFKDTCGKNEWHDCKLSKFLSAGKPHILMICSNVTEEKEALEALHKSEENFAADLVAMTRIQKVSTCFEQDSNFGELINSILEAAVLTSGAKKGMLQLSSADTDILEIAAQIGFDQSYVDFFSLVSKETAATCASAFKRRERFIVEDITKSPLLIGTQALKVKIAAGVRAVQSTPLINRRGELIGTLSTYWENPCQPDQRVLAYIDLLARQAADIIEKKTAENALRKSEEKYRAFVLASSAIIYRMSPDWAAMYQLSGQGFLANTEKENSKWLEEYIPPEGRKAVMEEICCAVGQKRMFELEHRMIRANGMIGWVHSRALPTMGENGQITEWFGVANDITARKQAEENLKKNENLLRTILENSRDGISMLDLATGKYVYMSPEQVALSGFAKEEIKHYGIEEVIARVHPDDRGMYINRQQMVANGLDTAGNTEYRWMVKNGEYRWFNDRHKLVRDDQGKPCALVGISRDTTERKNAENILNDSLRSLEKRTEELKAVKDDLTKEVEALNILHDLNSNFIVKGDLETIYEEILNAIVSLTNTPMASIQIYDNEQNMLILVAGYGLSNEFMINFRKTDLHSGCCGMAFREKKRIVVDDVTKYPLFIGTPNLQYLLNDNIHCEQSTPLISSSGKILGVLNTYFTKPVLFTERQLRILDMLARLAADSIERTQTEVILEKTSRQAMELIEELKKADQNKNEFISVLSHELRNPLAAILAGLQLLEIAEDADQAASAQDIMKRQMRQLCKLVDDLLDLTRITQNKIKLKKEHINVNELILNAIKDLKPAFKSKDVQISNNISMQPVFLYADPVRITQMIGNILTNALKFTQPKGSVRLTLKREEQHVVMTVCDNGIGISPEILPKLFTPFMQAENTLDRSNGGLGLGLSIVKGIVDLHGGSVSAHSEGPGKGSLITVRLPAALPPQMDTITGDAKKSTSRRLRLLLIEDNRDFAGLMHSMLEMLGYEASIAYDGDEGLKKAAELIPDVIICDIGLPGINGFQVAERIRDTPSMKHVCLVALTGYAGQMDAELSQKSGFHHHLAKPVEIAAIKNILDGQLRS